MYKVLIVDDERIAREGIKGAITWEDVGATVCGLAKNGLEAFELIRIERPEIVITDVRMPGLNGLELIAKVKEEFPETQFIVLSGYEEFEYAKTAMQYGVKHYLTKPCNEEKIRLVMEDVVTEYRQRQEKEDYQRKVREDFDRILPQLKGKVLRDFATDTNYGQEEWEYYRALFGLEFEGTRVRLILFQMEGIFDFQCLFALRKMAEDVLGERTAYLSTTIGENVLVLLGEIGLEAILSLTRKIKHSFSAYYERDLTIAISEAGEIGDLQVLFKEVRDFLKYRFYLGEGSIITKKDVTEDSGPGFVYDFDQIGVLVKSGDLEGLEREMEECFAKLRATAHDFGRAKTYCLELFMAVIRQGPGEKLDCYLKRLLGLEAMDTLEQIRSCIAQIAREITETNFHRTALRHSDQIKKVVQSVHEHLAKEELSLKWLAKEMLYMNVDYLGKLFRKETGEKFTDYVLRVRMEKAQELLAEHGDCRIFEIAEKVGFGHNTQYFSQVFKKYIGCTPKEFRNRFA